MANAPKAETKNQHYVPQFLLKQFAIPTSRDRAAVATLNLNRYIIIPKASIRGQCAGTFFYGEDGIIEKSLQDLEGRAATLIRAIIRDKKFPESMEDRFHLLFFLAAQYGRSAAAGREVNQQLQLMTEAFLKAAKAQGLTPEELENAPLPRVAYDKPQIESLRTNVLNAPLLSDLDDLLIVNDSSLEFALNDVGVVLHNHWTDDIRGMGTNGFACRGIVFFLPISPRHLIVKYDPSVYHIDGAIEKIYALSNESEVKALNYLQIVFAEQNLYFTGDIKTGESLQKLAKNSIRSSRPTQVRVKRFLQEGNAASELIHMHSSSPKIGLNAPWLKIRKSFAKVPLKQRVQQWRPEALAMHEMLKRDRGEAPHEPDPSMQGAVFRSVDE